MQHRHVIASAVLAATAIASFGVSPSSAVTPQATARSGCHMGTKGSPATVGTATCSAGTYYVHVRCTDELRGSDIFLNGPRVSAPAVSQVACPRQGGVQFVIEQPYVDNIHIGL